MKPKRHFLIIQEFLRISGRKMQAPANRKGCSKHIPKHYRASMMTTLLFYVSALLLVTTAVPAHAQVVITGHGIFSNCTEAFEYRDGPLFDMFDAAFADYDNEVENRIQATIRMFEQHRKDAESAYAAADADQKKRIAFTVGKWLFFETVGGMDVSKLPKSITDGYSKAQLKVFEETINASNNLKADVAASIATGNPPDDILADQATSITLSILGKYFGPVGAFLTGLGETSVNVAIDYWQTQPIKEVAQQEVEIFAKAIEKMHAKSKAEKISEINTVKNQIDAICGN